MTTVSVFPIWLIDFCGSAAMIIISGLCLTCAYKISTKEPDDPLASFLLWFVGAIFALSLSRSMGHIVKHLLFFCGRSELWQHISPYSGTVNTVTFIVISSVTLFFHRIQTIMERMSRDRDTIAKNSNDLMRLNKDIGAVIAERTRAEIALRIAHEVRNPVAIIGGMVRRLIGGSAAESAEIRKLKHILDQTRKLEDLVNRFQSVRPESKKIFSPIDLNPMVEEATETVQTEADAKEVMLLLDRSQGSLFFHGNSSLIKMAVIHILRNGIEACRKGDMIHIMTDVGPHGVFVQIQDNGPGIPEDVLDQVYEPTFRIRGQTTGLGIPYVKQIINEHMGTITIKSKMGKGTTVDIVLPTHLGELHKPISAGDFQI